MIIGFIGFGKVSKTLAKLFTNENIELITSCENRSQKTIENIKKSNVKVLNSFKEVAIKSDILISANSPKQAIEVAKKYGSLSKNIYLDLNNVSPKTTLEISKYSENVVDGAIIGKIDGKNPILYLSGENAFKLECFNQFISTKIISENIGDASTLKLLRSSFTKSLSAILIESVNLADSFNLNEEIFEVLTLTEGKNFKRNSESRIKNSKENNKRKIEELEEMIDYFKNNDLTMIKATLEKFKEI